ncbi:tRNA (guanine(46)-N(7))-methyltransferase [hydrothermal vent metagenome]|uniref:tRNA (guanine(46)-N(7))-methyltransferase n=1 Tax=hydrothermal vent metagenome TaxID=652676 RepID=A0A3B0XMZ4_9ZZZZ
MSDTPPRRIRSFVKREGRLTPGQQLALDTLWPEFGIDFSEAPLNLQELFGRDAETILEIGFGNGESLYQMAQQNPHKNYIGIEVHRPGAGHLLHLMQTSGCENIRISTHDAVEVLQQQITDASIDKFQLFFPDPWHKRKHHKRRIVQTNFIQQIARKLKTDGLFHMATDWEHYAKQMLKELNNSPLFINLSEDACFVPRPKERPVTKFEKRGRQLGHGVWDLLFQKK